MDTPPLAEDATCAVCLTAVDDDQASSAASRRAALPCCGRETAVDLVCVGCMHVILQRGGGVGRCPLCRSWLREGAGGLLEVAEPHGKCVLCRQEPRLIVTESGVCDACELGLRHRLRYICIACEGVSRIPHPMWRYATAGVDAPTEVTWACPRCQDYTFWRVHPDDLERVPADDAPASWGLRERWLADVRREREARRAREDVNEVDWFCRVA